MRHHFEAIKNVFDFPAIISIDGRDDRESNTRNEDESDETFNTDEEERVEVCLFEVFLLK